MAGCVLLFSKFTPEAKMSRKAVFESILGSLAVFVILMLVYKVFGVMAWAAVCGFFIGATVVAVVTTN